MYKLVVSLARSTSTISKIPDEHISALTTQVLLAMICLGLLQTAIDV